MAAVVGSRAPASDEEPVVELRPSRLPRRALGRCQPEGGDPASVAERGARPRARLGRLAAIGLLLALTGCLEYDELIVLRADGTGYIDIRYEVPRALSVLNWLTPGQELSLPVERRAVLDLLEDEDLRIENLRLASTRTGTRVSLRIVFESLEAFFDLDVLPNQTFRLEEDEAGDWKIRRTLVAVGAFRDELQAQGVPAHVISQLLGRGYLRFRVLSEIPILASDSVAWTRDAAEWVFPLASLPRDVVMHATLENPLELVHLLMILGGSLAGVTVLVGWILWRRRLTP